ncbi:MAG TPA: acyl-CoA dehydrogenase [Gammaproteobacteria bacterium]|nr:acyl-CoA dehydrogenase [Gammaproteobacteria bacterium]
MDAKIVNRRDLDFLLYELLDVEALTRRPRYAEHDRETFDSAVDLALRIASEKFAPHNRIADANEPQFDGERVSMIPEVKEAVDAYCEAGLMMASHDYELGGMQLPFTLAQAALALIKGANVSTSAYVMLTASAANLLLAHGSEEQKNTFAMPMLAGRYFGTMVLTEPQAGSSLGDIRTTAEPAEDGSYRIKGNKIFISAGDHELSENIVHLVLARIKGAPAGVKGISLFIVPKFLVNADGSLGERNDVALAGLIHKMGYRGTTSTMLNFGEQGGAVGYLIGEPNKGLAYMFHMMNAARIGVGLGATMLGYAGYLESLEYARTRKQGRLLDNKDPNAPPATIIDHPDVRRMLLAQKASVEGSLALCLYAARQLDDQRTAESEQERQEAELLLDILTPLVKAWTSHYCLEANSQAIQIFGGYGYTREYPVEQIYRDNRLNPIHEGTNGIQGLDLLGRKVRLHDGAALKLLTQRMEETISEAAAAGGMLSAWAQELKTALETVTDVTKVLLARAAEGETSLAFGNAWHYLDMMGHTVVAWLWLKQALLAQRASDAGRGDDFYRGKTLTCRYFFLYELPKVERQAALLRRLDDTLLQAREEYF